MLSLDADERITEELAREINHRLAAPDADAYKLPGPLRSMAKDWTSVAADAPLYAFFDVKAYPFRML